MVSCGDSIYIHMKKTGIRISVIIITFVIALIFFSKYYNQGTTDMTIELSEPTLPVAYIDIDGLRVNEMHGYVSDVDCSTLRDSVTPIDDDRNISFIVDKYDTAVTDMNVEVRSVDGERLIESTRIIHYDDYTDHINADIQLKDLIEAGREYNLILKLTLLDGREVSYYTRVIQNTNADASDKLQFVLDFNKKTFDKDSIRELSTYMEPSSDADNTDLGFININNSMNQLTWGDMPSPAVIGSPSARLREIGDTMASIELTYVLESELNRAKSFYNVTEYYRIRRTDTRFYLLSFSRTVDQIFVMDKDAFDTDMILLGIEGNAPELMESEGGDIVAFANEGRLYSYNVTDNKLIRLFAFFDTAKDDLRSRYRGSDVKLLDIEENGNISFMIYGYMNRGIHEGEVGIDVCYYDSVLNTIEEQAFIPYERSAEILRCDMENLSFLNAGGDLFIFLDGIVYKIIPGMNDASVIAQDVNEDTFFVSDDQSTIVWQEPDKSGRDVFTGLSVMSLTDGKQDRVTGRAGEYVRPIGFMENDLIYGICRQEDLIHNRLGDVIFPMNKVLIRSTEGDILKEYNEEDIYVTSGVIDRNQITLNRAIKQEDSDNLIEIEPDHITSNSELKEGKNTLEYYKSEDYETVVRLKLKKEPDIKSMKLLTPKEVLYEGGREIHLKVTDLKDRFLVYGDGRVVGIYDRPAAAVAYAYTIRGTVMDIYGNEIYRRGETVARNQIMTVTERETTQTKDSMAVCLDTMLYLRGVSRNTERMLEQGQSAYDILNNNLDNTYILNLTGCPMDVMLYYVNQDIPVLVYMNDGSAMLMIGFNEQNIVVMDPVQGTIYKIGRNDSRNLFEQNGNRFMTYAIRNDSP